jgi:RNA polymerase sigma-70 factor (ECF subfamily)
MRALALGLVHDTHEADDVVGDATLAALLHPPPASAALRPWLAAVVRNFASRRHRAATRRSDHEDRARRPEHDDDDVDALERIDLQRKLLDAVRQLPESQRTIVVQRYFEGRTSAEIARSQDVPAGTVRARLKRGLEQLRERLDRESGSREAWMALMLPLVPREFVPIAVGTGTGAVTASLVTQGALTMTVLKISLSAAAVVLASVLLWNVAQPDAALGASALAPETDQVLEISAAPALKPTPEPARSVVDPKGAPEPAESAPELVALPPASVAAEGRLEARFVDAEGTPWVGVELRVLRRSWGRPGSELAGRGVSDGDGRVAVTVEIPDVKLPEPAPPSYEFQIVADRAGCSSHHTTLVVREGEVANLGEVVLVEGAFVRGHVVDERGAAVGGARVGSVRAEAFDGLSADDLARVARVGSEEFEDLLTCSSEPDGSFELVGLPLGRLRLWAHAPGMRFALSEVLETDARNPTDGFEVVLADFGERDLVRGRVVGPDGKGRQASLHRDARRGSGRTIDFISTDEQGRFEFRVGELDTVFELGAVDGFREFADVKVTDVRPGDTDVVIAFVEGVPLLVHVRDQSGEPVLGAQMSISTSTTVGQAKSSSPAPGDYLITCPNFDFSVRVEAPGFRAQQRGPWRGANPPAEVDFVLERALGLHGLVRAAGGPVAGAVVSVHRYDPDATMTVNGRRCPLSPFANGKATTDSEGRFELAADLDGPFVVRAVSPGWADAEFGPMEASEAGESLTLELTHGGAIEGFVRVPEGESLGGRVVAVHRGDGRARSQRTADDGSYRFEGLMTGDWTVYTLEQDLPPRGGSYASYDGREPLTWDCRVELGRSTRHDLDLTQ